MSATKRYLGNTRMDGRLEGWRDEGRVGVGQDKRVEGKQAPSNDGDSASSQECLM